MLSTQFSAHGIDKIYDRMQVTRMRMLAHRTGY